MRLNGDSRTPPSSAPLSHATAPNSLWCIDFKGDFATGASRCYPLTLTDAFSRYLIACVALPNTRANGSPFASPAPAALSEISAWWFKLGIRHERIDPGKPQQNGRHERMHLTLKQTSSDES